MDVVPAPTPDEVTEIADFQRAKAARQFQGMLDELGYDAAGEADPYVVQQGYSRENYYLSGTDKRGFSTPIRGGLPPRLTNEITVLVQSGKYPWTTSGQFVVDAIFHRLADVASWSGEGRLIRALNAEMLQSQMEVFEREMNALVKTVEAFDVNCDRAVKSGDWAMLTAMIINMDERLDEVRDPYKGQIIAVIAKVIPQMPRNTDQNVVQKFLPIESKVNEMADEAVYPTHPIFQADIAMGVAKALRELADLAAGYVETDNAVGVIHVMQELHFLTSRTAWPVPSCRSSAGTTRRWRLRTTGCRTTATPQQERRSLASAS